MLWTQPARLRSNRRHSGTRGRGGGKRSKRRRLGFGATMAEVAALAGVTKMTVSRVLRHPEKVTPATRARVSEAMATMGYVPNRLAGSLTAGATGLVAAIVPTLRHSLFADTLEGLSDVLSEAGLDLIVSSSRYRTDVEESQIRSILERRPDAIVLTGLTHTSGARDLLADFGIPVVETWETGDEPVDMVVGYSNREAAHAMTARADPLRLPPHRLRQRTEREQRARPPPRRGLSRGDAGGGAEAAADPRRARRGGDPAGDRRAGDPHDQGRSADVDALFFTSDVFAVGAILACRELGIGVPDRDRHRRLPRPRDRPRGVPDADHGARAGDGDGPQGRRR